MQNPKLAAALEAAAKGFRVFPVVPDSKAAAIKNWPDLATTDRDRIEAWWLTDPLFNIGIATGQGLLVVDADVKNGKPGLESLALLDMLGLPTSLRTTTPSGGVHVYLRVEGKHRNQVDTITDYPGIDIRGDRGYVLGPGSTIDGTPYVVTAPAETVTPAPGWFLETLGKPAHHAPRSDQPLTELDKPENVARATTWLRESAPEAVQGAGGDDTTFRVACRLRDFALSQETALDLLLEHWNEDKASPPWPPDDLEAKVGNAFAYATGGWGAATAAGEFGVLDIDVGEPPSVLGIPTSGDSLDPAEKATSLDLISAAAFASQQTPERQWIVKEYLPDRNVSTLGGDGATGKSLLAMQLAVACSAERHWLGLPVKSGPVLYFSAEDDEDETHIRLKAICEGEGIDLAALDRLKIALMAGKDALLAVESTQSAILRATALFARLKRTVAAVRPVLVVLDNLADVFGGNENVKSLARQFIGMLRGLAIENDCAVLLLAHPSLTGMSSGSGSSGNVAWNNSVRSRLYLRRDKDEDGTEIDPNLRVLETKKANYAATGSEIEMRWEAGRFVPTAADFEELDGVDGQHPEDKTQKAERVFLEMVARFNQQRRPISPSNGANYAPALFARHHRAGGVTQRFFELAMCRLLETRQIAVAEFGPPSRRQKNIELARDVE